MEELVVIQPILKDHGELWGQVINLQKSSVFFLKVFTKERKKQLCNLLGVRGIDAHSKYLRTVCYAR